VLRIFVWPACLLRCTCCQTPGAVVRGACTATASHVAHCVLRCCCVGVILRSGLVFTLGSDHAPKGNRATFIGIYRLVTDGGSMAGPLAGGIIVELASVATASWASTAVGILAAVWMHVFVRETMVRAAPPQGGCRTDKERASSPKLVGAGPTGALPSGTTTDDACTPPAGVPLAPTAMSTPPSCPSPSRSLSPGPPSSPPLQRFEHHAPSTADVTPSLLSQMLPQQEAQWQTSAAQPGGEVAAVVVELVDAPTAAPPVATDAVSLRRETTDVARASV